MRQKFERSSSAELVENSQGNKLQPQQTIAVTATFTAEPLAESLTFWLQELQLPGNIEFAPYNQIFQQLLAPDSLVNGNKQGINIILLRLEDWQKYRNSDRSVTSSLGEQSKTEQTVQEFIQAIKATTENAKTPCLVCLCPNSPAITANNELQAFFQQMESMILSQLAGINGLYLISSEELNQTYPVDTYYEEQGDKLGHIPFTPLFFAGLGTAIARKIYAIQSPPPKVIVLDCDHTIWKGVCGEDGVMGIEIDPPRQVLQELMLAQYHCGMLICLCSKNNEEDVVEVFERRQDMPLKREHIISWRVNWNAKSENIISLAEELNLGLDSFIFIDDNPVECAEVQANCPEVLTLLLPTKVEETPRFLQHIWAFDRLKITTEDKKRTSLYKENIQRDRLLKQSPTLENFLEGLGLEIKISPPSPQQNERVAQLTQRTNQFNLTTIRRSEQEIAQLCRLNNYECLVVEVSDRFGDYGLVGVLLFTTDGDSLIADTFLLSCRVLGRGVEHKMLARLGEIASERGIAQVKLAYVPSEKNQPALNFLNAVGSQFKQQIKTGISWQFPTQYAQSVTYNPQANNVVETESVESQAQVTKSARSPLVQGRLTRLNRIATELYSASQVFEQIQLQKRQRPDLQQSYVAPRTATEQQLAQIWKSVLRVDNVGIHDNFFDLGGTSVVAVQLFVRIENIFGKNLPLPTLLQAGTIEQLALVIQLESSPETWSSLITIAKGDPEQKPPLFCIHAIGGGALYYRDLVEYLDPNQPVYGLEARGLDGKEPPFTSIKDMAAYYIQQIFTVQPPSSNPYFLAGSSMGGLIAFEIAYQLQNQGQKIGLIALFDTISPVYQQFSFRNQVVNHLKQGYQFTLARVKDRTNLLKSRIEQKISGKGTTNLQSTTRNVRLEVEVANKQALKSYKPQAYPLQVSLFRAINQPVGASWYFDTHLGWDKLATQGVKVDNVPGDHLSLVAKPQVEVLAAKFEQGLKAAQTNPQLRSPTSLMLNHI